MSARDRNEEIRERQKSLRYAGSTVSFHDVQRMLESAQAEAPKPPDPEVEKLQLRIEQARPFFLDDGLGLRGPQNPVSNLTIDGADGLGFGMQVRRERAPDIPPPQPPIDPVVEVFPGEGVYVNSLGNGTAILIDSNDVLMDTVAGKSLKSANSNLLIETPVTGEILLTVGTAILQNLHPFEVVISSALDANEDGEIEQLLVTITHGTVMQNMNVDSEFGIVNLDVTHEMIDNGGIWLHCEVDTDGTISYIEVVPGTTSEPFWAEYPDPIIVDPAEVIPPAVQPQVRYYHLLAYVAPATGDPQPGDFTFTGGSPARLYQATTENLLRVKRSFHADGGGLGPRQRVFTVLSPWMGSGPEPEESPEIIPGYWRAEDLQTSIRTSAEGVNGIPVVTDQLALPDSTGEIGIAFRSLVTSDDTKLTITNEEVGEILFTNLSPSLAELAAAIAAATANGSTFFNDVVAAIVINDAAGSDITISGAPSALDLQIKPEKVTNVELAFMNSATIKGQIVGGGFAAPVDLSDEQATAILKPFTNALKGLVPASGGDETKFLCADATFKVPPTASGSITLAGDVSGTGALGAVVTTTITDNAVTKVKVSSKTDPSGAAIGTAELEEDAVTGVELAGDSVGTDHIIDDAVTNPKLANMAASTIKGQPVGGAGDPVDMTGTQATEILNVFTNALKGLVPASGGGTTKFARADGTWAVPAGGGSASLGSDDLSIVITEDFPTAGTTDLAVAGTDMWLTVLAATAEDGTPTFRQVRVRVLENLSPIADAVQTFENTCPDGDDVQVAGLVIP